MEMFDNKPKFNVQQSLEQLPDISNVKKIELDEEYFKTIKTSLVPEVYETIKANYEAIDVHSYTYLSDGLKIAAYIWSPKNITESLPLTIWNRGGNRSFGAIGDKRGSPYENIASELSKRGSIVIASEYRGGFGSEGSDEWGGNDLNDVIRLKEIVEQLPMCQPGKAIVVGASRGAMMSYQLAAKEPWVKALISLCGAADLLMMKDERPEMGEVFNEAFGGSEEEMIKRSATHFYEAIPKDLPLLIMQGDDDDRVSVEQVRKLVGLLDDSGHTIEYHEFPGANHYFFGPTSPQRQEALDIIMRFCNTVDHST